MAQSVIDPFIEAVSACLALGSSFHANILVKDTLAVSGNFINQILLRIAVQAGHKVLLVPVEQSLEKYKFALKKMGVNLQQGIDEDQVAVVSPCLAPQQQEGEGCGQGGPQGRSSRLRQLLTHMAEAVHKLTTRKRTDHAVDSLQQQSSTLALNNGSIPQGNSLTIIVDGLSELSLLAASKREWLSFLHYCLHLGAPHQDSTAINRILRCHVDGELLAEDRSWVALVEHNSRLVLSVQSLEGHIADLDGQVTFSYRQPPVPAATRHAVASSSPHAATTGALAAAVTLIPEQAFVPTSSMYFRGGETGVRWFAQVTGRDLLWH